MRLLVISDLHLSPGGKRPAFDRLSAYTVSDVSAVILLGDLLDKTDDESITLGREIVGQIARTGLPVLSVPGNHDPLDDHRTIVSRIDGARVLHGESVSIDEDGGPRESASLEIAGWGCEQFDQRPAVTLPESVEDGEVSVTEFMRTLSGYVRGDKTSNEVASVVGTDDRSRAFARLETELTRLDGRYRSVSKALDTERSGGTHRNGSYDRQLVCTHVPPFGTTLDMSRNAGGTHRGSIALRLALSDSIPLAVCSGHFHRHGYDDLDGIHLLNPGYRAAAIVEIDLTADSFTYDPIPLTDDR